VARITVATATLLSRLPRRTLAERTSAVPMERTSKVAVLAVTRIGCRLLTFANAGWAIARRESAVTMMRREKTARPLSEEMSL
jgi:hypothetical protein